MAGITTADVLALQESGEADSATLQELLSLLDEKNDCCGRFAAELGEIEGRETDLRAKLGLPAASSSVNGKSSSAPSSSSPTTSRRSSSGRKKRASNPYNLQWYIRQVMSQSDGVLPEDEIVKGVLDMGYQTNAADPANSVYTTLYKMQTSDKVRAGKGGKTKKEIASVKRQGKSRNWKLTADGRASAQLDSTLEEEDQKLQSAA